MRGGFKSVYWSGEWLDAQARRRPEAARRRRPGGAGHDRPRRVVAAGGAEPVEPPSHVRSHRRRRGQKEGVDTHEYFLPFSCPLQAASSRLQLRWRAWHRLHSLVSALDGGSGPNCPRERQRGYHWSESCRAGSDRTNRGQQNRSWAPILGGSANDAGSSAAREGPNHSE